MIIDSHTHLNRAIDEPDFFNAVKRMLAKADKNNIDKIIIIANTISGTSCASTREIIESIGSNSRFMVVGSPNIMSDIDANMEYLEALLKSKKIIGLKLFPGHEKFYLTDKRCTKVYELASKYSCPVIIHTGVNSNDFECARYNDPKYIVKVANKYPGLRIIIAHLYWPKIDYCLKTTKDTSNIYYDTSAMADDEVVQLCGGIEKIKSVFKKINDNKPNHLIFGTDYDICDQDRHIELIESLVISDFDKKGIFADNFMKCFDKVL